MSFTAPVVFGKAWGAWRGSGALGGRWEGRGFTGGACSSALVFGFRALEATSERAGRLNNKQRTKEMTTTGCLKKR
jgi:hypothetical protein